MARLRWANWISVAVAAALLTEAGAAAPAPVVAAGLAPPAAERPAAAGPPGDAAPQLDPADEVASERTATTATYDLGGGRYAVEAFAEPVFYRPKGSGAFVPIEAGFEPVPGPDKAAVSAAAPTTVTVAPAADPRGFLAVEDGGGFRVAYRPLAADGAADAARAVAEPAVRDGVRSDIAEVFPGVDARVFARADGAKLFLVLRAPPQDPAWTFRLDVPEGARLVSDGETGAIGVVDGDGARRLVIAAPYAVDSTPDEATGSGRTTTALHYAIGQADDGSPTLTVSIDDAEWLAEAVYPVYVDPTIYNDGTTSYGDAHVNRGNPSFNYGNYQRPDSPYYYEMWLGESPSNPAYYNEAFIRFDLASLAGKAIDSASLEVRPYHQYYNSPTTVRTWLRRVTSSWAENTITWNTKPTVTTTGTVTADCVEGAQCAFSVLALTRAWVDGTYANHGVRLDENGNGPTYWKRLIAAEQQTSTRPRLIVTYHDPAAVVYPSGGASSSRTFSWAYSGHSAQSAYQVQVATSDTFATIVADSGSVASAATSWGLPLATVLTPGTPCHWRVRVKQAPNSAWSAWATTSFTYDPAALGLAGHHRYETFDAGGGDALAVDVSTLNAVVTHPIVALPYRGGRLDLTLTHNAQDTADVGLGRGWQLDVSRRIEQATSGTVVVVDETGGRHAFIGGTPTGGITPYARPHTLYGVLTKDTNVSPTRFTLTYKDQSKDTFELSGTSARLVRAEDRHGNALTFEYTGGLLTRIKDPASREVVVAWAGAPARLASITDWATVTGGIVAASGTPDRLHRFFYDGSGRLSGWAGPLNTAGTCPATPTTTVVPHLVCLGYDANGYLATISKALTVTTLAGDALGTTVVTATVAIDNTGTGEVRDVRNAVQYPSANPDTLRRTAAGQVEVVRRGTPDTTTRYGFASAPDPYARVTSVSRKLGGAWIEQRTTYDATYPIEPASITDNYGGLLSTPARTVSYTYLASSMGLVSRMTEPLDGTNNRTTDYLYNANNDVTSRTVALNGGATNTVTRYCYHASSCNTTDADPKLYRVIENYKDGTAGGTNGNTEDVTTTYQVDAYGQRTREKRANYAAGGTLLDSAATGWTYDSYGNVTAEIANYADGAVTNPGDDVTPNAATGARTDLTTAYAYDTAGNRVSTADPRRAVAAALGTSLGADDYISRATYDPLNLQRTDTTPTTPGITITQKTATSVYDELGNVRQATDFGGLVTGTEYDRAGRATMTFEDTDGAGAAAAVQTGATTYDAAGRVLTVKDQRQVASGSLGYAQTAYDELGRQIAQAFAVGTTVDTETNFTYDALGRRTAMETGVEDPSTSQRTRWAYDLGGRTTETDDEFTCTSSSYDYRDLVTTVIEGRTSGTSCSGTGLRTITNTYDGRGRLTEAKVTAGTGLNDIPEAATYDGAGNRRSSLATKAGSTSSTTYTLNPLDQVTVQVRSAGTTAKTNYDPAGNPTDRCLWSATPTDPCKPAGSTFSSPQPTSVATTTFDARNNRYQLVDAVAKTTTVYDPDHNYQPDATYVATALDAQGRVIAEHQTDFGYDAKHRLLSVDQQVCPVTADTHICSGTATPTASDDYLYDNSDNRTQVGESKDGGAVATRNYCYDAVNRLRAMKASSTCTETSGDETFTYDDSGNRLTAAGVSFTYNSSGQLATCTTGCGTVAHDVAGRIQKWNGWAFEYDAVGRMTRACQSTTDCTGLYNEVEFSYDAEGHRTQIQKYDAGNASPVATWDFRYQGDAIVEEKLTDTAHPAGTVVRSYVVDDTGSVVKMTIPAGEAGAGSYLVTWNGHGDALGLWRIESDGTLTLANSYSYSTWGTPTTATHNGIADLGFRFLYVGEFDVQWDSVHGLGLLYMHARHYAPTLGRFLQPDPDGSEDNLYAYASNSPVTEIDPDGTCFILCVVLVPLAVGAIIDTVSYLATSDRPTAEGLVGEVAAGSVMSILPVGKIAKVGKLVGAGAKILSKIPKAGRIATAAARVARPNVVARAATSARRFSPDQEALVALARDAKRRGPITRDTAEILDAWRRETGLPGHPPMFHPCFPTHGVHMNVGPIRHIRVGGR